MTDWEAALQLKGLRIDRVSLEDEYLEVEAHRTEISVNCPYCGQPSSSVHSHYYRHLGDLPISNARFGWWCRFGGFVVGMGNVRIEPLLNP